MLRDLVLGGRDLCVAMTLKDGAPLGEIAMTAHAPEAAMRFVPCGAYPAQQHPAVATALDVARVMRDRAVHVIDRVGGSIVVLPLLAVQYRSGVFCSHRTAPRPAARPEARQAVSR